MHAPFHFIFCILCCSFRIQDMDVVTCWPRLHIYLPHLHILYLICILLVSFTNCIHYFMAVLLLVQEIVVALCLVEHCVYRLAHFVPIAIIKLKRLLFNTLVKAVFSINTKFQHENPNRNFKITIYGYARFVYIFLEPLL